MRAIRRLVQLPFSNPSKPSPTSHLLRHKTTTSRLTSSLRASVSTPVSTIASAGLVGVPVAMAIGSYTADVTKRPLGLDAVPDDATSRPHHVRKRNGSTAGFRNVHPSTGGMFNAWAFVKALIMARINGELDTPDTTSHTINVRKPTFLPTRWSSPKLRATWLGHAAVFAEYPSGLRVLFDPVFEHRCSPVSWLGPQRYTPSPCDVADLPVVDAVLISHNHYDHLSSPTVQQIAKRFPDAHFFVPLGLEKWFHSAGITKVTELDWWEGADLTLTPRRHEHAQNMDGDSVKSAEDHTITARVSCLPSQHTSRRTGLDTDATLWCSWAVSSSSGPSPGPCSVYFAGDTGYRAVPRIASEKSKDGSAPALDPAADYEPPYDTLPVCPQFAQVGELRGPFDLGLLPIGAYKPRHGMSHMHCNPFDAVELFLDTRCKRAVGIHWGTWMLTAEDVMEPPELLKLALRRRGIEERGVFDVCDIGESREF